MQDQDPAVAIRDLKTYARRDREIEIEEQTIIDINSLSEQDALWYIRNLRGKPRQVRATGKNQMDVSGTIITMDTLDQHSMKALIDSGCTGLCITIPHGHFVRVQGPTQPLTATSSTLTKRLVESLFLHPYLKLFHSTFVYVPQCEI